MNRLLLACLLVLIVGVSALLASLLLPDVRAAPPTGPPRLVFETSRVSLGRIEKQSPRDIAIAWRREGVGSLEVLAVDTGCGCAIASGLPDPIPEGASGKLVVRLVGRKRVGPLRFRMRIVTDAPEGYDVTDVVVTGHVEAPVRVSPTRLDLGRRSAGSRVRRPVVLTFAEGSSIPSVRVRLLGTDGVVTLAPVGRDPCRTIDVDLAVPDDPGPFNALIEVDLGPHGALTVPIRAEVVP